VLSAKKTKTEMHEKIYDIRQRSFEFAKDIVRFVSNSEYDRRFYSIFDQVLRSGTSIGANIEEGKAGSSKRDFRKFYIIALKSANETKYWLSLIKETKLSRVELPLIEEMINESEALAKIIASIVIKMGIV
jgi:four helix bundle protein